ncbi:winged helix-turn-helix domain-containing protein [Kitasatospora sp. GP82]|uniref:winged helix-turn-helix domain-containing protein n=1 Tax=Kitasatospora sp. GP82 TaxID=3035089 RepID=UPI002474C3BF|nr:winged helix-turn-helix domain-containing protein [Kitasatospora sp. GP82]
MDATPIDPDAEEHPYQQIAADIIRAIRSGELKVGSRVPSEAKLIQTYGVARNTARHAVEYLRDEGWVHTRPQRGTFVAERVDQVDGNE